MTTLRAKILHPTRLKAAVAGLLISSAALTLTAKPASAASEYMQYGSTNWSSYVTFNPQQFYCTPGHVGTYGVTVKEPTNWSATNYIVMFDVQTIDRAGQWQPYIWKTLLPNGVTLQPGQAPFTIPGQLWSNIPHGYYKMYLQVEIRPDSGAYAQIQYEADRPSDYVGGYGVAYYCHI